MKMMDTKRTCIARMKMNEGKCAIQSSFSTDEHG